MFFAMSSDQQQLWKPAPLRATIIGGCVLTVKGMYSLESFPAFFLPEKGRLLLEGGEWSAVYESVHLRWRVTVVREYADGSSRLHFFVCERTGLVKGTGPTPEQIIEDGLREFKESVDSSTPQERHDKYIRELEERKRSGEVTRP